MLAGVLGFVGMSIFATTPPVTRLAVSEIGVWFVTFGRAALAAVPAAVLLFVLRQPFPSARLVPRVLAVAALTTVAYPGTLALAMQIVPATHAGVVLAIVPVGIAVCAVFVAGERPSPLFWLLSAAGGATVAVYTLIDAGGSLGPGDFWLLVAAVFGSLAYALSGATARYMPGWAVISWALVLAFPANATMALLTWDPAYATASAEIWAAFVYLALFSMFFSFFFWNRAMAMGGVARIGQLQLLAPFVTFAVSAALLGEPVTLMTIGFACVVVAIVFLAQRARVSRKD